MIEGLRVLPHVYLTPLLRVIQLDFIQTVSYLQTESRASLLCNLVVYLLDYEYVCHFMFICMMCVQ